LAEGENVLIRESGSIYFLLSNIPREDNRISHLHLTFPFILPPSPISLSLKLDPSNPLKLLLYFQPLIELTKIEIRTYVIQLELLRLGVEMGFPSKQISNLMFGIPIKSPTSVGCNPKNKKVRPI